ncbi:zf-RING_LisH domain-containing protein [Cephalotus follicularis]|uniref:Zf-RING_LisH domain-containing protein n=1 Tax=Cephalotus follicularis TaxID=3775 RepID=A0A1Q3BCN9_CEPFO|nr:zf-RING_LisH domain-containing protein [Cephalotus follicularis]
MVPFLRLGVCNFSKWPFPPPIKMWSFASNCVAGSVGLKTDSLKLTQAASECSDDEVSSVSREEGLECHICWESFNIVENVPYVLWCGHTLCKNCILGLQWAVVKFPTLPIQLPLFISCPWCNLLSFRLVYKGTLKFPRKNYFLLWMVESLNGDRVKSHSDFGQDHHPVWSSKGSVALGNQLTRVNHRRGQHIHQPGPSGSNHDHIRIHNQLSVERIHSSLRKSLVFFVQLTAKFPLVIIFLLIILYAIPASAAILALYILITVLFALPSFLILYFAYPSLDWLVREIIT